MRKKKSIQCFLLFIVTLFTACQSKDYTQYVNPFIGCAATGHTFPGATYPFGLVQVSPDTKGWGWDHCSGYHYKDTTILGFSQTHLNGTGCIDLGDILVMPIVNKNDSAPFRSTYYKETEKAKPGFYGVRLKNGDVDVELTASPHVAFHRYTFNQEGRTALLIDLQHGLTWNEESYHTHVLKNNFKQIDDYTFSGETQTSVWVNRTYAYIITFNKPVKKWTKLPSLKGEKGLRSIMDFDLKKGDKLLVKVALSTTSVEGAQKNLSQEIPNWNYSSVLKNTTKAWNKELSKATAEGSADEKTNYYTALYHLMIQPNNIADVDGYYRGEKDSIKKAPNGSYYSTLSLWDTYRAAHPLYTILQPKLAGDVVSSMVEHCKMNNYLPIWALMGKENNCMIANHAIPVIVEAYLKGIKGFNPEEAYSMIKRSLTYSHGKTNWEWLDKYGFFPCDLKKMESVSLSLECCYDDYAASVMANKLGKTDDAAFFARRADNYKNLFDPETNFMRPRLSDSTWYKPFAPSDLAHTSIGGAYTEGNAWQYTWHVQHDVDGLINLFPSKEAFLSRLDSLFSVSPDLMGKGLADVTGLIGQYAHGNEPSHHIIYLFNMAGKPHRTEELVREVFDKFYLNKAEGLSGNDDCGQMSAWYLFSAMGFYPVSPVSGQYIFGAPQFKEITLHLDNGNTFTVKAHHLSKENKYVKSIRYNGKLLSRNYLNHEEIMNGGTLEFEMSPQKKQ